MIAPPVYKNLKVKLRRIVLIVASITFLTNIAMAEEPLERSATNPTGWKWYYNVSPGTISTQVSAGYRVIDLEVVSSSPHRFNVAFVKNSGTYSSGWWWYYGITASQLSSYIASNDARLIDFESYYVNGVRRFAAVMIKNSGTRASGWYYYYGQTLAGLVNKLSSKNARLIDVDTYVRNGVRYYNAVMIKNTGANAKAWWWYTNVTTTQIKNYLNTNKARLIDIERQSNGRYTVAMVKNSGVKWWWHVGVSASTVSNFVSQYGARIADLESYVVNGVRRFNVIYLDNVNSQTSRVRDLISSQRSGGSFGLYVKQVNGSTKASLKSTTQFEPASTIKVLHHIHGMKRVYNGLSSLNTSIQGFANYNGSCPIDSNAVSTSRSNAHRKMMEDSNNAWTQALRVNYTQGAINNTASILGMSKSSLNHRIGCGTDAINSPNRLTLVDAGKLYEIVRNGYLGYGSTRDTFYDLMSQGRSDIFSVVDSEAAKLGLSAAKVSDFKARVRAAAKAGSYGLSNGQYKSIAGWVSLPSKLRNGAISNKQYVHGVFVDKASTLNASFSPWSMRGESLREQIKSALITYKLY